MLCADEGPYSPIPYIVGGTIRELGEANLLPVVDVLFYGCQQSLILFRGPRVFQVGSQHLLPAFCALCGHMMSVGIFDLSKVACSLRSALRPCTMVATRDHLRWQSASTVDPT